MSEMKIRLEKLKASVPAEVEIIAVSKKHSGAEIRRAYELGLRDFGENFFQEAREKKEELKDLDIRWHFIGKLQRNKVKDVAGEFELIHSVDSLKLAAEIDKRCLQKGVRQDVLLQTNFSAEASKSGFLKENFKGEAQTILKLEALCVRGVMDMPPLFEELEGSEQYFRNYIGEVKAIAGEMNWEIDIWSLGTSTDFLAAIAAGSNMIRVGTNIFGPRRTT